MFSKAVFLLAATCALAAISAKASDIPFEYSPVEAYDVYEDTVYSPEAEEPYQIHRVRRSDLPFEHHPVEAYDIFEGKVSSPEEIYGIHRVRRSLQPGAPTFPLPPQQQNGGWSVSPNVNRDQAGNTMGNIGVQHKGENHDFNAQWGKVISGPNKAKPTWNVGGSYRW